MDNNSINDKIYGSADEINKMYKDLSYFDQYGGSVFLFILLILILFIVVSYSIVMKNIQPIKDNWAKERCTAKVIPFAGLINAPEGTGISDYTQQNFTYCMQDIIKSITGIATQPLTYLTYTINLIYKEIAGAINSIRNLLSNIRTNISNVSTEILGRILSVTVPVRKMLIAFNDMGQKVIGILTSGLYTSLSTYYALKAFFGALLQIIIAILIASIAIIIGLWLSFAWPPAIAGTILFVSIAIICAIVIAFMKNVLHVSGGFHIPSAPKKPKISFNICFDKDSMLKMYDGTMKKISELQVGDYLWDYSGLDKDNYITATLKLDAKDSTMYRLGDVIVSALHQVKHNGVWIFVKEHPSAVLIENYSEPIIYCLNTSSKEIVVGDYVFTDWDEVTDEVFEVLNNFVTKYYDDCGLQKETVHKYFDLGFEENKMIHLENGLEKSIGSVQLGDVLKNSVTVYGIVEIYRKSRHLEKNKIYHLLTDKKIFYVGDKIMTDYNCKIDCILEQNKLRTQFE
jgi:hypothetical protein